MLPILFSLGPVKIYSYGVMLLVGLFISLYWWWKMGRDEHFDEIMLFDGFFLSVIIYFLAGRMGYVILHMSEVGTVYRAIAFLAYPGINTIVGLSCTTIFIYLFARAQSWMVWKVTDAYVVALSLALIFGLLGAILNGSNLSWQVNVAQAVWAIVTFVVVSRVRKDFRFYAWYKGESSMAQEGLASLIFGLLVGVYFMMIGLFGQGGWQVGIVIFMLTGYLIYKRVGRRENTLWGKLSNIIRRK